MRQIGLLALCALLVLSLTGCGKVVTRMNYKPTKILSSIAVRLRTIGIPGFPHERWLFKLKPFPGHV